jgi:Peptidase family S41
LRIGYIELPSFYQDRAAGGKTASGDVSRALARFDAAGVDVALLDLRHSSGGMVAQAISLTSLFINSGPVFLAIERDKRLRHYDDDWPGVAWLKPLVVLTSRNTGSSCEIFCAAIQDYNRGLLVGDESTAGKGMVQNWFDVSAELFKIANPPDLGKLQLTTSLLFRPNGEPLQGIGVQSDVVLPSATGLAAGKPGGRGTAARLRRVAGAAHEVYAMLNRDHLQTLRDRSSNRRRGSVEFDKLARSLADDHGQGKRLFVSLNRQEYTEQRKALATAAVGEAPAGERDFYLNEALAVTTDYVNLLSGALAPKDGQTAAAGPAPAAPGATPAAGVSALQLAALRKLQAELLDIERAIAADSSSIAKYQKEVERWNGEIRQSEEVMKRANSNGQRSLVGFGASVANVKKSEATRNLTAAKSSLEAGRGRLAKTRTAVAGLLGVNPAEPAQNIDEMLRRVTATGPASPQPR